MKKIIYVLYLKHLVILSESQISGIITDFQFISFSSDLEL